MLYDYQYTVISIFACAMLLVLSFERKNYASGSNRVFMSLIYSNLVASAVDLFTYFTISFPDKFSLPVLYGSNMIYLFLYGLVAMNFVRYIGVLIGTKRTRTIGYTLFVVSMAAEAALIFTTPLTHWIIYYDENLIYAHGRLFNIMYLLPVVFMSIAIYSLFKQKMFVKLQKMVVVAIFVLIIGLSALQILFPRADIFHLSITLAIFGVYAVFENPAYYTFHSTGCLNGRAFYEEMSRYAAKDKDVGLMFVGVTTRQKNHGIMANLSLSRMYDAAAERMKQGFKGNAFCVANGKFMIVLPRFQQEDVGAAEVKLMKLFDSPLQLKKDPVRVDIQKRFFRLKEMEISDDYIDHLVETIQLCSMEQILYSDDLTALLREQHEYREMEEEVAFALQHKTFTMNYQPIVDSRTEKVVSAEALVRLKSRDGKFLSPEFFIPAAEKNGSIVELGNLIFRMVCRFWLENNLDNSGMYTIGVNISPIQLMHPGVGKQLIDIMKENYIEGKNINLEILESSIDTANEHFYENVNALMDYGVSFSLDDFGSGFASAGSLFALPIQIVKVDKGILWEAMRDESAKIVFLSTLDMMQKLGKKTIIEGAEDEAMLELIRSAGGDFIQGYYFSRPLSPEKFMEYLNKDETTA